jgi:hypothetical protein
MPRQKGQKNKVTTEVKDYLKNIIFDNAERLNKELDKLQGTQFIKSYIEILAYVIPKATTETGTETAPAPNIVINLQDNELKDFQK